MTNDNTRTKANAVFFSVLMVLSVVAVGFAAAPAAAQSTDNDTITSFGNQIINSSNSNDVTVTANLSNDGGGSSGDRAIIVTYTEPGGDLVVAGKTNSSLPTASSQDVTVTIEQVRGAESDLSAADNSGEYTAHVLNETVNNRVVGEEFSSTDGVLDSASATIFDQEDGTRSANIDDVYNGSTIFQGEDGLTFVDVGSAGPVSTASVSTGSLQKTAGDTAGTALTLPIGENTATGTYAASDGYEVIVQEPRITTAEVVLTSNGNDVSQINPNTNVQITAEWNFESAEDIDLTVDDAGGTDITNQVLTTQTLTSSGQKVDLDLADEDAGDYTVSFEGSDDVGVVEEYTITKTNDDTVSLDIAQDSATQGDNVEYTVSGGTSGNTYLAIVESGDYAEGVSDGSNADEIFRNVGDTVSVGNHVDGGDGTNYSYAEIEIDDTTASGSLETQYLTDSSITVEIYGPDLTVDSDLSSYGSSTDDDSIEIAEGAITLDSPGNTYTVGEEVDITGASESADNVRLYAQNNGEWKVVEIDSSSSTDISVESDDTFEAEDVVLSEHGGSGNDILSFAGNYRLGVIDASEADTFGPSISTSDWTSASSTRSSITVIEGELSGEFLTYNGQVAELDDAVDVEGAATGQNEVVVVFVGERGQIQTNTVTVDSDGTFDETDLSVSSLDQGTASAHIISIGRDNVFGSSDAGDITNLENNITSIGGSSSLSGAQVRDRIVALTTDADASDDLMVTQTFRLNDGQVSIDSVAPEGSDATGINPVAAGDSMVVTGTTNRQADDNSIVVNLFNSEGTSIASADTDVWGTDGQYTVTVDTSDIETGTYSLEADTGDNTDRAEIELVESVEEDTAEEDTAEEDTTEEDTAEDDTQEDTTEEDTTEEETTEEETTEEETTEEESTDDSTPGFGALVALVALVAAALLATRRRDE